MCVTLTPMHGRRMAGEPNATSDTPNTQPHTPPQREELPLTMFFLYATAMAAMCMARAAFQAWALSHTLVCSYLSAGGFKGGDTHPTLFASMLA